MTKSFLVFATAVHITITHGIGNHQKSLGKLPIDSLENLCYNVTIKIGLESYISSCFAEQKEGLQPMQNPELMRLIAEQQRQDYLTAAEQYRLVPPKPRRKYLNRHLVQGVGRSLLWRLGKWMTSAGQHLQRMAQPTCQSDLPI